MLLPGVHFALYREVTVGSVTRMDYTPIEGYEDLVSTAGGVIPMVDGTLAVGTYYLKETTTPTGYEGMKDPVRFTVTVTGTVELTPVQGAALTAAPDAEERMVYTLMLQNVQLMPSPTGVTLVWVPFAWMLGAGVLLAECRRVRAKKQNEDD